MRQVGKWDRLVNEILVKLTQGGYPSVVTNVFDPTDKRICGSSPFGPINWSNISQSRLEGLKFWESIFRIEFEIISDCFEFNKRTFNSSQLILCLTIIIFRETDNLRHTYFFRRLSGSQIDIFFAPLFLSQSEISFKFFGEQDE